jgi:hypothetical protein
MKPGAAVWLFPFAVTAVAAFFGGRALHSLDAAQRVGANAYDLSAPSYQPSGSIAGFTKGGFTGFSDVAGLEGQTVVAGRVTAVLGDSITIATPAGDSTIRITGDQRLRRIAPSSASQLSPGSIVVALKRPGTNETTALLLIADP